VFATRVPRIEDHLARYRLADVCLDTFPYNGHTTASDVLYMSRPLVGLGGQGFASRVSTSLLHDAGQSGFACTNVSDYEKKAAELAEATLGGRLRDLLPNAQEGGHVASSLEQAQAFADCIHDMQPISSGAQ
jgi:protein O-GlcNAc transferase